MENKKINFEIKPIFNQNDIVWRDFTRIEMTCESVKYGYKLNAEDERRIMFSHKQEWNRGKYNYAFGAYIDGKMIGFVNGYLLNRTTMYLRNLYVLPEFNGNGVGRQLLNNAEKHQYWFQPKWMWFHCPVRRVFTPKTVTGFVMAVQCTKIWLNQWLVLFQRLNGTHQDVLN